MQRNFPVPQNKHAVPLLEKLEKELTDKIIDIAIEIHRVLGPGLLESAYQVCMERESSLRNIPFERLVDLPLNYKGIIDAGYVIDLVYNKRVVELKAIERVSPVQEAQLLTYMRLTGIRVGLLINFSVPALKDGIYRRVL